MAGNPDRVWSDEIDYSALEIHALAYIATQSRGNTMIDYTDMFTRIQSAEKEARGMGLLGDVLGDAYIAGRSAGERLAKPETAYSGELLMALQGHTIAAAGEWGDLLSRVSAMVRNARNVRGY